MTRSRIVIVAAALLAGGCNAGADAPRPTASAPAILDDGVPPAARAACLAAVGRVTANPDLVIVGTIASEAASQVTVGVGPDRAPWRCLVSRDGVVADVMSLTDEGAL